MYNFTILPLRIEGLVLSYDCMASSPLADFSRLPWNDGRQDIQFNQPFVGNGVVREPFEDQSLLLKAGTHLHFIIPHFLGQQLPDNAALSRAGKLAAAPNRWLITKSTPSNTTIAQWVVESDYIHEETYEPQEVTAIVPFNQGRPYRYMGRKTLLSEGRPDGTDFKSLGGNPLTVIGYGDINFSSFYPNCLSVFGMYDSMGSANGSTYQVLGWHADAADDIVSELIGKTIANAPDSTFGALNEQLKRELNIQINQPEKEIVPNAVVRTLFYGEFKADSINLQTGPDRSSFGISIGNTGTEALSAFMADRLSGGIQTNKHIIEEQLEAALLNAKLDPLLLDSAPKFLEIRHEKGFRAHKAGHLWSIREINTAQSAGAKLPLALPDQLASALHQLNTAQHAYDLACDQIQSLREQLYLDWYKYMHARYTPLQGRGKYPDPDRIMHFIQNASILELNNKIQEAGSLTYQDETSGFEPSSAVSGGNTKADAVVAAWTQLNAALTQLNKSRTAEQLSPVQITLHPGARFWEAHAPVLLISGLNSGTPSQSGSDSIMAAVSGNWISSTQSLTPESLATQNAGDILVQCKGNNQCLLSTQEWNPFILDWEMDMGGIHLHTPSGAYDPQGLQDNMNLNQFGPDFLFNENAPGALSVFSGTVLMSPHAKYSILRQIKKYFSGFFKKNGITFTATNTLESFLEASSWSNAFEILVVPATLPGITSSGDYTTNPIRTLWEVCQEVQQNNVLSQTLNGFNQACIMKKKVAQLPIEEPLGFEYEQQFTKTVKSLVATCRDSSPVTAFGFNPVHGGKINVNRLSLIDNFGIMHPLDMTTIPTVASETIRNEIGEIVLPPRLSQPARLHFRWLHAQSNDEMNSHPASSPICGWLMADYLNQAISVYASDGTAIGYIDTTATWKSIPWKGKQQQAAQDVQNIHLLNVIQKLCSSPSFFDDFISATQNAQQNIAPASSDQYNSTAILMGKPIAIVRSKICFETKGLPAIDQSWSSLLADLDALNHSGGYYNTRSNNDWTQLKLPVRLGEHAQLNDGLIGYWMEDSQGNLGTEFFAPQTTSTSVSNAAIDAYSGYNHQTQWLALNTPAYATMLMDPRGHVHATTGILPVKAISIPPEHFLPAMKKLAMWFQISPLLQPKSNANLYANLPKIPGYNWQWWDSFAGMQPIQSEPDLPESHATNLLKSGWLLLTPQS